MFDLRPFPRWGMAFLHGQLLTRRGLIFLDDSLSDFLHNRKRLLHGGDADDSQRGQQEDRQSTPDHRFLLISTDSWSEHVSRSSIALASSRGRGGRWAPSMRRPSSSGESLGRSML